MIYCFAIDETIYCTKGSDYENSKHFLDVVPKEKFNDVKLVLSIIVANREKSVK